MLKAAAGILLFVFVGLAIYSIENNREALAELCFVGCVIAVGVVLYDELKDID